MFEILVVISFAANNGCRIGPKNLTFKSTTELFVTAGAQPFSGRKLRMAELRPRSTDRGHWITISSNGVQALSAHWPNRLKETPLTVYWRGRTDTEGILGFFDRSTPQEQGRVVAALIFTAHDRIRLDRVTDTKELRTKLPPDTSFLRVESLSRRELGDPYDPDFIIWSRVDLSDISPGEPAPDDIGIWLTPSRLSDLETSIAEFISQTHINKNTINHSAAGEGLKKLTAYLHSS